MSMTLDELHSECEEAAKTGALVELDPLTAQALVEDCIDYNAAIIRLETMLGHGADGGPSMDTMLDEVRAIVADFAALKACALELKRSHEDYRNRDFSVISPENHAAQARFAFNLKGFFGLIDRLEPNRSPVLEIAGINHE